MPPCLAPFLTESGMINVHIQQHPNNNWRYIVSHKLSKKFTILYFIKCLVDIKHSTENSAIVTSVISKALLEN